MPSLTQWTFKMALQDKTYYVELGKRIAHYRKAQGLTQVQLAERLGIAQQTLAHYEGGHLRIAVALLAALADTLSVSVEELINDTAATKKKRGPASVMQRQFEQIRLMPRTRQKFMTEMIDALIKQQQAAQN